MTLAPNRRPGAGTADSIRFICPFPPGGSVDGLVRAMAADLAGTLDQPIIVETHTGANGALAARQLRAAPADGNAWMMTTLGVTVAQAMTPELFPAAGDFTALALIAFDIPVIVVPSSLPVHDLGGLLALARREPGSLNYLRTGVGSQSHLVAALLQQATGVRLEAVDYRGLPPGIIDLLAGRIQLGVVNVGLALPHLRSGALRAIAAVGPERLPQLPELPTLVELGLEDASITAWAMAIARRDTPRAALARASAAFQHVLAEPTLRQTLLRLGVVPARPGDPADTTAFFRSEQRRYRELVLSLGIRDG